MSPAPGQSLHQRLFAFLGLVFVVLSLRILPVRRIAKGLSVLPRTLSVLEFKSVLRSSLSSRHRGPVLSWV